jgi:hypothetical protein
VVSGQVPGVFHCHKCVVATGDLGPEAQGNVGDVADLNDFAGEERMERSFPT